MSNSSLSRTGIAALVLGYAALSALWVLASDRAVEWLLADTAQMGVAHTLKGWVFVAITSLLLYLLLRGRAGSAIATPAEEAARRSSMLLPLGLIALAVLVATVSAIGVQFRHQRETEATRMQAIAEVKTRQIADWLAERQGDATAMAADRRIATALARWTRQGDRASRDELIGQLRQYGNAKGYSSLMLLDAEGRLIWDSAGEDQPIDDRLAAAVRDAIAMNNSSHPPPYRDADGRLRLDFVAPLATPGGERASALILRTNPSSYIFPLLRSWPVPSASAETLMFRREGDKVLYLNDLLYQSDAAARFTAPLATAKLLAAQVLRGEITPGAFFEGEDYRKVPVLGVVRPVSNTDWYVIAKMDRSELFAQAWRDSLWLGLGGLLTLFMIAAGAFILRQRQSLSASLHQREAQAERLRLLELLDNLVRS